MADWLEEGGGDVGRARQQPEVSRRKPSRPKCMEAWPKCGEAWPKCREAWPKEVVVVKTPADRAWWKAIVCELHQGCDESARFGTLPLERGDILKERNF